MKIIELKENEINISLFSNFNRYQDVKKCWRKEDGQWLLKDVPFVEQWGHEEYEYLVKCLKNTVRTNGVVIGAFDGDDITGFASIEGSMFGSSHEYLQLSSIHVSHEKRGMGKGKEMFLYMAERAKEMGAKKLYISAHSSEETQVFYRGLGCREAQEYNEKLALDEPCDCQLEYVLDK